MAQRLRFSYQLAQWLAMAAVASSWSVTIDSAEDLICKGGAGFSKYGASTLVCTCAAYASRGTEECRLRLGTLQAESRTCAAVHRTTKASAA